MIDARLENIPKEKFAFVNENKNLTDKELVTKPVGYLRDAWNRFKEEQSINCCCNYYCNFRIIYINWSYCK